MYIFCNGNCWIVENKELAKQKYKDDNDLKDNDLFEEYENNDNSFEISRSNTKVYIRKLPNNDLALSVDNIYEKLWILEIREDGEGASHHSITNIIYSYEKEYIIQSAIDSLIQEWNPSENDITDIDINKMKNTLCDVGFYEIPINHTYRYLIGYTMYSLSLQKISN